MVISWETERRVKRKRLRMTEIPYEKRLQAFCAEGKSMCSDEMMELARGRGRVKSLDSVAGGSCSRSSKDGLIDLFLEIIFSIASSREKNYKDQRWSGSTRAKTCLVFEESSVLGEGRGGSEKEHTWKVAAAACG